MPPLGHFSVALWAVFLSHSGPIFWDNFMIYKNGPECGRKTAQSATEKWFRVAPITTYQFQKDLFCLIILYILVYFIHVYIAPGPQDKRRQPWGQFFDGSRKVLSLWSLVACCKKIALPSDFMHIFSWFYTVHSPWSGADNSLGPKFLSQQEGLIILVICCKFKKISSTSGFIHIFSSVQGWQKGPYNILQ